MRRKPRAKLRPSGSDGTVAPRAIFVPPRITARVYNREQGNNAANEKRPGFGIRARIGSGHT